MANRYLVAGGTGDFDSTTNWSTTSGGSSGASKPTSADAIIINSLSGNANLTVSTTNSCLSINCSGYTGTLTINSVLTVTGPTNTGDIALSTGMTLTGTGTLKKTPTGTTGRITNNSVIIDCNVDIGPAATSSLILTTSTIFNKNLTFSTSSSTITTTILTSTFSIGGDLILNHKLTGTVMTFIGSGTSNITPSSSTSTINQGIVFNKSGGGIVNIVDIWTGSSSSSWTHTAGIVNHTGTLFINNALTFNTSGIRWNILQYNTTNVFIASTLYAVTIKKSTINWQFVSIVGGIDVDNFEYTITSNGSSLLRLKNNIRFKVNNSIIIKSEAAAAIITVSSDLANNNTLIDLGYNSTMVLYNCTFTDINAVNKSLRALKSTITPNRNINCFSMTSNIKNYNKTF